MEVTTLNEIKNTVSRQLQQLQTLMHRIMFSRYGKTRSPHRGQGRVLAILKLKPVMSQKELTYLLNMSKQSVAELAAKLEKSGYITREPSEEDKRIMTIRLTDKGAKAADNTDDSEPDMLKILDCLNNDELTAFSDYLDRIIGQCEGMRSNEDFEAHRKYVERFMSSINLDHEAWQYPGYDYFRDDFDPYKRHGHHPAGRGHSPHKRGRFEHEFDNEKDNE